MSQGKWQEMIDVDLTGVWKTTTTGIQSMLEAGRGGTVILTSSIAGLTAYANMSHYVPLDEARFVTGTTQVVDAGGMSPLKIPHA